MQPSDNKDIRHIFQKYGITDKHIMDRLFEYYKESPLGKTMSFAFWMQDNLVVEPILERLLSERYTIKTFENNKSKNSGEYHDIVKKFLYAKPDVYQRMLQEGLTEDVYILFLKELQKWLDAR